MGEEIAKLSREVAVIEPPFGGREVVILEYA
jgi:hypothetical protein